MQMRDLPHDVTSLTEQISSEHLLGELLVLFGFISAERCSEGLRKARSERQMFGASLVADGTLSRNRLKTVIKCQSLIREGLLSEDQALSAIRILAPNQEIEETFIELNIDIDVTQLKSLIGEFLLKSGCINEKGLKFGLDYQKNSVLALGQILVSHGYLTEELLAVVTNAQKLVRAGIVEKFVAIESLKTVRKKDGSRINKDLQREENFYRRPQDRTCPRLEELLLNSNLISKADMASVCEKNLLTSKEVSTILLESKLLEQELLDTAVELLKFVKDDFLSMGDAHAVLIKVKKGQTLTEALLNIKEGPLKEKHEIALVDVLKAFGCVNNAKLAIAFDIAKYDSEILSRVLLNSGMQAESSLRRVVECHTLIQKGLSLNDAQNIFDLSNRKQISIKTAMQSIRQTELFNDSANFDFVQPCAKTPDEEEWRKTLTISQLLIDQKNLTGGRLLLETLLKSIKEVAGEGSYAYRIKCLDSIADTYVGEQNFALAERYYSFALDSRLEHYDTDSLECAHGMSKLAKVHYFQNRYDEAEKYVKEYIRICSKWLGATHSNVACGWQNMATIYQAQGRFHYAEHAYKIAIKGCLETIGEHHPTTVRVMRAHANLLMQTNCPRDAEALHASAYDDNSGSWRTIDMEELADSDNLIRHEYIKMHSQH